MEPVSTANTLRTGPAESMPQAMSACPAATPLECVMDPGAAQPHRPVDGARGGGAGERAARRAVVGDDGGEHRLRGVDRDRGTLLDRAGGAGQSGHLGRQPPGPESRGRYEQRSGCPDDEHEHVRSWSHQEGGAGSGNQHTPLPGPRTARGYDQTTRGRRSRIRTRPARARITSRSSTPCSSAGIARARSSSCAARTRAGRPSRSPTGRSPPTTRWASTTPGGGR